MKTHLTRVVAVLGFALMLATWSGCSSSNNGGGGGNFTPGNVDLAIGDFDNGVGSATDETKVLIYLNILQKIAGGTFDGTADVILDKATSKINHPRHMVLT